MELSKLNQEILKAIKKGYTIDELGNVYNPKGKKRKLCLNNNATRYYYFNLTSRPILVHRFVGYFKYGIKIFERGLQVRHLNGNSIANNWDNIGIGTLSDNRMDVSEEIRLSTAIYASQHVRRFSDEEVENIRKDKYENGMSYNELRKKYNISSKGTLSYLFNKAKYY